MKVKSLAGYKANMAITANGQIAAIRNSYLMLFLNQEQSEQPHFPYPRQYVIHLRTIFWETDHKKIWFVSNEILDWKCLNKSDELLTDDQIESGRAEYETPQELGADMRAEIKEDFKFFDVVEEDVFPLENKDFWLNAMRSHVFNMIEKAVAGRKVTVGGYFMTEEHYLTYARGTTVAATTVPSIEYLRKLANGKPIEFAPMSDREEIPLCNLPISEKLQPPKKND